MTTLYISEFSHMGQAANAGPQTAHEPPIAEQTVAVSGSSAQSSAFNVATRLIRLHSDTVCSYSFGQNPTATAVNARMAANQTEYHSVPEGGGYKVAVISNS